MPEDFNKCMVVTIGVGRQVEAGLARAIETLNPDIIIPIASQGSTSMVEERLKPLVPDFKESFRDPVIVSAEDDVERCTVESRSVILGLLNEGIRQKDIVVDFTSGTKAMSAGLCVAAVFLEVGQLSYVSGDRRTDNDGRVITGTERVVPINPTQLLIIDRRRQLKTLFNKRLFADGLRLVDEMSGFSASEELAEELGLWRTLFETYLLWDTFDHAGALKRMKMLSPQKLELLKLDLRRNWSALHKITTKQGILKRLIDEGAPPEETLGYRFTVEMLADILANADRRKTMGRYDDAVARLYRSLELIEQIALAEYGIDTADVLVEKVPSGAEEFLENTDDGKKVTPLNRGFKLLNALDSETKAGEDRALVYLDDDGFKKALQMRNLSILAHGYRPATEEDCDFFESKVMLLAHRFFPDVDSLLEESRFPFIEVIL